MMEAGVQAGVPLFSRCYFGVGECSIRRWQATDSLFGSHVEHAVDGGSQQNIDDEVDVVMAKVSVQEIIEGAVEHSGGKWVPKPEVMSSLCAASKNAKRRAKELARDKDDDEVSGEAMIKAAHELEEQLARAALAWDGILKVTLSFDQWLLMTLVAQRGRAGAFFNQVLCMIGVDRSCLSQPVQSAGSFQASRCWRCPLCVCAGRGRSWRSRGPGILLTQPGCQYAWPSMCVFS